MTETRCLCKESPDPDATIHTFEAVDRCETVITSIKDYLILQSSLNCIASGVCFWFVALLWRSRYGQFHSGLRRSFRESFRSRHRSARIANQKIRGPVQPPSPIVGFHSEDKNDSFPIYDRHEDGQDTVIMDIN